MKILKSLFFTLLITSNKYAVAQDAGIELQGTIGSYPIVMSIDCDGADCYGSRYLYLSKGHDIEMQVSKLGNHYTCTTETGESFDLMQTGSYTFSGTWQGKKGKTLKVTLQKLSIANVHSQYDNLPYVDSLKRNDPMEYLRCSLLSFVRDSDLDTTYNGKQFVWFHEVKSGVTFFRLGNGFSKEERKLINPKLDALHIDNAMSELTCTSSLGDGDMDYTTTITYLDKNLLGFKVFAYYDCGGAHPDFGGIGYLYDLHSGKNYDIDDIITFDKSATTEAESGFDAFDAYREKYFAPKLMALEDKEQHHFKSPDIDTECNFYNTEVWKYPEWSYTEKGIEFTPDFPHVEAPCRNDFLLPFEKLKEYKNPKFPYGFPLQ